MAPIALSGIRPTKNCSISSFGTSCLPCITGSSAPTPGLKIRDSIIPTPTAPTAVIRKDTTDFRLSLVALDDDSMVIIAATIEKTISGTITILIRLIKMVPKNLTFPASCPSHIPAKTARIPEIITCCQSGSFQIFKSFIVSLYKDFVDLC